jgi:hypothetical protein
MVGSDATVKRRRRALDGGDEAIRVRRCFVGVLRQAHAGCAWASMNRQAERPVLLVWVLSDVEKKTARNPRRFPVLRETPDQA